MLLLGDPERLVGWQDRLSWSILYCACNQPTSCEWRVEFELLSQPTNLCEIGVSFRLTVRHRVRLTLLKGTPILIIHGLTL